MEMMINVLEGRGNELFFQVTCMVFKYKFLIKCYCQ